MRLAALLLAPAFAVATPAHAQQNTQDRQDKQDPARAREAFNEGRAMMDARRFNDAAAAFEHAVQLDSTRSEFHLWLGYSYTHQLAAANVFRKPLIGRRIGPQYDKAVALDSSSVAAAEARVDFYLDAPRIVGGGADRAQREAARLARFNAYRGGLALAKVAEKTSAWEQAETTYRQLMQAYPDSAPPHYRIGMLREKQGDLASARTQYDSAIALNPGYEAAIDARKRLDAKR